MLQQEEGITMKTTAETVPLPLPPRPVSQGGEGSPEGYVVADAHTGVKSAAMMDLLELKLTLITAEVWMGQHQHGGGEREAT